MNIGINGYYLGTHSGIGQYSEQLLLGLAEVDTKNEYFIFIPRNVSFSLSSNFHCIHIKPASLLLNTFINRYYWEEFQLGTAIKRYEIELFHSLYASIPRQAQKIQNIVTIHDTIPWRFPYYKNDLQYWIYLNIQRSHIIKRAKNIITDSKKSKKDIAEVYGLNQEKIQVIYPAIDPIFFTSPSVLQIKEFKEKRNTPFIVYSGGFQKHKNIKNLIYSFKLLVEKYNYAGKLYILGDIRKNTPIASSIYENFSDLKILVESLQLSNKVIFTGYVDRNEYSMYIKSADLFISLSLCEGFGLPALEAVSAGTPCILSKNGVYEEIEGNAAMYVDPLVPIKITEVINKALSTESLKKRMRNNGHKIAANYNRTKMAKEILNLYRLD